jgi:hypothetical protein
MPTTSPMAPLAASYDGRALPAAKLIVTAAGLTPPAQALLAPDDSPREYLDKLLAAGHASDVVRFLGYVLPKREAIWWVWVCARKMAGPAPAPVVAAALDAAERWIVQPNDATRRAAFQAAEAADIGTPAGCAGVAIFFSGGSIAPPNAPEVPPLDSMTAKAVVNGITLAAVAEPATMGERWIEFARMGLEVAERIKLWGNA